MSRFFAQRSDVLLYALGFVAHPLGLAKAYSLRCCLNSSVRMRTFAHPLEQNTPSFKCGVSHLGQILVGLTLIFLFLIRNSLTHSAVQCTRLESNSFVNNLLQFLQWL